MKKKTIIIITIILGIGIIICVWSREKSFTMASVSSKIDKIKAIIINEMNIEQEQMEIDRDEQDKSTMLSIDLKDGRYMDVGISLTEKNEMFFYIETDVKKTTDKERKAEFYKIILNLYNQISIRNATNEEFYERLNAKVKYNGSAEGIAFYNSESFDFWDNYMFIHTEYDDGNERLFLNGYTEYKEMQAAR